METDYYQLLAEIDEARLELARETAASMPGDDTVVQTLAEHLRSLERQLLDQQRADTASPDEAFIALTGLTGGGPTLTGTSVDPSVRTFDDTVLADRLYAVADLYFIYMHERLGVFDVALELQRQFNAGQVNLSTGLGAQLLYRYDRRRVLRYTGRERQQAYRRVFGYYRNVKPTVGAEPFDDFHQMFAAFNRGVAKYSRDRRVSEVIRPGGQAAGGVGSIASVRRLGLDLRNRLKKASYGHVNVLTREVAGLLRGTFDILEAPDVLKLYGASDAWDVIDTVSRQHLRRPTHSSQRNRMAVTGRETLRWLAGRMVLTESRPQFEILLRQIEESCEEWLTSEAAVRSASSAQKRAQGGNVISMRQTAG